MGGGLMQLVAYGAQDVYLTGNAQITFFKVVYRRHTNFSMECIEHTLNGNPDFGRRASVTIARNGDLATQAHLMVTVDATSANTQNFGWVRRLGHALLEYVEVEIGGSQIDKHYGTWLDLWFELARADDHDRGYANMIGDVPQMYNFNKTGTPKMTLYIPLQFWFCRNTGLALPLIALQYHEVKLHFKFSEGADCLCHDGDFSSLGITPKMSNASVLVNYIYLDSEERRRFAQVGHEYLIEQVQFTGEESASATKNKYRVGFNHPCKELVWAMKNGNYSKTQFLAYTSDGDFASALGKAIVGQMVRINNAGVSDDSHATAVGSNNATIAKKIAVDDSIFDEVNDATKDNVEFNGSFSIVAKTGNKTVATGINLTSLIDAAIVQIVSDPTATPPYKAEVVSVVATGLTDAIVSSPADQWTVSSMFAGASWTNVTVNQHTNYGIYIDGTCNPVKDALLQLNGHDRFQKRDGNYFNYVQTECHHTNTPADGVNVYSFAINPEQHQPSGTANLSRIDDTQLCIWLRDNKTEEFPSNKGAIDYVHDNNKMFIFALSYNVLRIMSGMGGLAYSN